MKNLLIKCASKIFNLGLVTDTFSLFRAMKCKRVEVKIIDFRKNEAVRLNKN